MAVTVNPPEIRHPGEFIGEELKKLGMTQKELALRSGYSEKHISTVIAGIKDISLAFARRFERATGIMASDLLAKQIEFDQRKLEIEERNHIQPEEYEVVKRLHDVISYLRQRDLLPDKSDDMDEVMLLRDFLGISDLSKIPQIAYNAAYRAQVKSNTRVDPYVLFAWQEMCERLTDDITISASVDIERLRAKIPSIRKLINCVPEEIDAGLRKIFADCGIAFCVVMHFTGAPVQGFIKESQDGRLILCITLRQMRQDIFWFTLFHEIAHILNGDVKQRFVDFDVKSEAEERADDFARETLLPSDDYREFIQKGRYLERSAIAKYAKKQGVPEHIVYGRLLKDKYLEYNREVIKHLPKYVWLA